MRKERTEFPVLSLNQVEDVSCIFMAGFESALWGCPLGRPGWFGNRAATDAGCMVMTYRSPILRRSARVRGGE